MFSKTLLELKKIKFRQIIFPIASYAFFSVFLGRVIDLFSDFGNYSYLIATWAPLFITLLDRLSGGNILSVFFSEWKNAPIVFHILIIINFFIYYNLLNLFIPDSKKIWTRNFCK
jgi:hypothetical protein